MSRSAAKTGLVEEIKDKDRAVVLFYAAWCPFSRRFLPHFEAYAEAHPEECRTVEADADPGACDAFDIEIYPSVLIFRNGQVVKRLDGTPGVGLSQGQLESFCRKT